MDQDTGKSSSGSAGLAWALNDAIDTAAVVKVRGRVREVIGTIIRAAAPSARIGELCTLSTPDGDFSLEAEVIGFTEGDVLLSPIGDLQGICSTTFVTSTGDIHRVGVGPHLLGRVLDGFGRPIDGLQNEIEPEAYYPVYAEAPNALTRQMISRPLCMGVRAIDSLLTCGEGQRIGIFAAAGGGKSTLLGMLAKNADADIVVIALVGERGREVREFIERELGPNWRERAVIVCATSDRAPLERVKAGFIATAIAEYFRDQGKRVLLLMDSVTRLARAQREIGLAAGEPPTRRGFPPSVFAFLPRLMERAGFNDKGSITAFYTVLVEGDDMNEPVADETRSILDGHIILSHKLGAANHYPAISILQSVSRVMPAIVSSEHRAWSQNLRKLMAKFEEIELLLRIGEYKRGSDAVADVAIDRNDAINAFLCQQPEQAFSFEDTLNQLKVLAT
ncbi:type III secretion system ATPase SctN [Noviherbaspirillum sp.]|jgi:type III secretion protein N (ATPase)|uniref:type III secretion system ATPase SctN n=1 Tax=Noviherbaspirillum sp. TaxID=1926288 RepID=UPI0025D1EAE2|nr:type III secretion system ATPase SctN [Noviherbaspirillum sp.]